MCTASFLRKRDDILFYFSAFGTDMMDDDVDGRVGI